MHIALSSFPVQYLLSSYPLKPAADTQMSVLLKFDPSASPLNYKDAQTGVQTPIANGSAPLAGFARKTIGQGQLLINLAQPVVRSDLFFPLFYSSLLMAFSQNVIVNYYAEHKVKSEFVSADAFPALEADIALTSTYETVNLFSGKLKGCIFVSLCCSCGFSLVLFISSSASYSSLHFVFGRASTSCCSCAHVWSEHSAWKQ